MSTLVGDASGLVSLAIAAGDAPDPLAICLERYTVVVPETVVEELQDIAAYGDVHGQAAAVVLGRRDAYTTRSIDLDAAFPLDDGENAAIQLANELDADLFCCDEFTHLGLIHASLADTRLVTTPTMLSVFVRTGAVSAAEARALLAAIRDARSWDGNAYVQRARMLLEDT